MYKTEAKTLSESQLVSIMDKDENKQKTVMPFKVRRYSKIQDELLDQASPDGLTTIPVYTEIDRAGEIHCPYTKRMSKRVSRDEIY